MFTVLIDTRRLRVALISPAYHSPAPDLYEQAQLDHAVCYVLGTPDDEGVGAGGTFPQEKVVPAN